MKEKQYSLDDQTGIENKFKQDSLDTILFNLENLLKGGTESTVVDEVVKGIDLRDINEYMSFISTDKTLSPKLTRIISFQLTDLELFEQLTDYTNVHNVNMPLNWDQRIYFVESKDFAVTFIPIELSNKKETNIYMEPLEDSPDFITEIWAELTREKSLGDLDFVDPKDLM